MRNLWKKSLLFLLVGMLAFSGVACKRRVPAESEPPTMSSGTASPTATPIPIVADGHSDVHFSEMEYERPDTDEIRAEIHALDAAITDGAPTSEMLDAYYAVYDGFGSAESAMSLAYLLYAFDVTDAYYEQEYAFLQTELNDIDLAMTDVTIRLIESSDEAKRTLESAYGPDFVALVYEQESLNSEEIQSLQEREVSLVNTYNRATNDFRFTDGENEYTYESLFAIEDMEEFERLYAAYLSALNEEAGNIFLEMVSVRAEIAEKLGYGSYAAYMYDCYGRDFTLEDAERLQHAVKSYIVPVYLSAYGVASTEAYAESSGNSGIMESLLTKLSALMDAVSYHIASEEGVAYGSYDLSDTAYPLAPFLDQLQEAATDFSPDLNAALRHMRKCGLYDFSVNPNKMSGSFTTYMSEYDAPFIFSQWENEADNMNAVIHELGHFLNYYRNPAVGWSAGDSLDLAEVDSQGLELLMMRYYDRFYGELAPYAEREMLVNAMYALLSGCMEDEFQQTVYENPNMTLSEMNAVYKELAVEYGFDALYTYNGEEWVEIPHTFQSPMYYISYAASMVPALTLWRLSQTDLPAAKSAYFQIVDRSQYAAFQDTVSENGLPDPFAESTVRDIAAMIEEHL